ncbi:MAG: hypothetical protein ACRD2K_03845 [Terriglobales bacterium]
MGEGSRSLFLARCDACRWQERHSSEEGAEGALNAHAEEFHQGVRPSTEDGRLGAQVTEIETEKVQKE